MPSYHDVQHEIVNMGKDEKGWCVALQVFNRKKRKKKKRDQRNTKNRKLQPETLLLVRVPAST